MTKWTLAQIKNANTRAGFYFFSRATMRFFKDSLLSFKVREEDDKVYIERVRPMRDSTGRDMGGVGDRWEFNPLTGNLRSVSQESQP